MWVKRKNNDGFEDQFTTGALYWVEKAENNSYFLVDDRDQKQWCGMSHFTID